MGDKRIVIVGAGLGGLCAAIKLQEAGYKDFVVLDKNPKVGGTWFENTYPGVACDVQVALYQYSFAQSPNWTRLYPGGAEIQAYAEEMVSRYQLQPHLRLGDEARSALWTGRGWRLTTAAGKTHEADALIAAVGQLNRPQWPDIEGLRSFAGPKLHSARWDHALPLAGKRIACIGSAASAAQLIPEIAKVAGHLTVFQRTPNWVVPRNDRPITPEERALAMTDPVVAMEIAASNRRNIYLNADHFFFQAFGWTPEGRASLTRQALDHLDAQVKDPALRKALTPDYPIGCKRIIISDDFYPALQQPNVTLATSGIARIEADAVVTKDGKRHGADVLVCATGFETTKWHWSLDVVGERGQHLGEVWAKAPSAHRGVTVHGFPNLFMLYGPNTNLGHNSILLMEEAQVHYIVGALKALEETRALGLHPSAAAQARFNEKLQHDLQHTVWADPHCASWYKNADGIVTQNWPHPVRTFVAETERFDIENYDRVA